MLCSPLSKRSKAILYPVNMQNNSSSPPALTCLLLSKQSLQILRSVSGHRILWQTLVLILAPTGEHKLRSAGRVDYADMKQIANGNGSRPALDLDLVIHFLEKEDQEVQKFTMEIIEMKTLSGKQAEIILNEKDINGNPLPVDLKVDRYINLLKNVFYRRDRGITYNSLLKQNLTGEMLRARMVTEEKRIYEIMDTFDWTQWGSNLRQEVERGAASSAVAPQAEAQQKAVANAKDGNDGEEDNADYGDPVLNKLMKAGYGGLIRTAKAHVRRLDRLVSAYEDMKDMEDIRRKYKQDIHKLLRNGPEGGSHKEDFGAAVEVMGKMIEKFEAQAFGTIIHFPFGLDIPEVGSAATPKQKEEKKKAAGAMGLAPKKYGFTSSWESQQLRQAEVAKLMARHAAVGEDCPGPHQKCLKGECKHDGKHCCEH